MTLNDTFAYIPLFAVGAIALVLMFLLVIIKKRSTARVSFIIFISDALLILGSFISAVVCITGNGAENAFIIFGFFLLCASFFLLPYCLVLSTFEPKVIDKLVPKSYNKSILAAEKTEEEEKVKSSGTLSEKEETLLKFSKEFMLNATSAYTAGKDQNSFLEYINRTVMEQIKADGGAILLVDDFEDVIAVKAFDGDFPPPYKLPSDMPHKPVRVATSFKFASFPLRDNLFGEVASAGKPELITKPERDDRIYQNGPEEFLECGSYIIIPMKIRDTVIGLTAFARKHGNELFTEEDLKTATTLSDFAAMTIQNVNVVKEIIEHSGISKESEISARIQTMLKPSKLPLISGVEIGTIYTQADGVCGDYYDVIVSRKDRVSFIISDIAGKGINSVVVMTMVRAMLRLVVNTTQSAGKILSWVNRGISAESFSTDHFGSVTLINYDPTTQNIEFACGGATPVYYFDGSKGEFELISEISEPIGVEKTTEYKDYVQKVKSGDIIVTYTDGLVESLNEKGQQYSKESLLKVIRQNSTKTSKEIVSKVKSDLKNFSGNVTQHDDETLLVIKIQ